MTTSTPNGTKVGRPPCPARARLRDLLPEMSDRTFARFWWAWQVLITADEDGSRYNAAVTLATRPNGSLNVAALERSAWLTIAGEADAS